ncbi:MAG: F0F1 ATP synthase subunit epsilon [Planctomycetales bacterium]|nr:F0F1 ATP synthase subunit epsilon [Planctomycetales bacterium]
MSIGEKLRLVIVTPERTLFDEPVSALRFPLYDGDIGVLPGRLPLIGRLGSGELKVTAASGEQSFFIDGGFAQVQGSVISLLTHRALPAKDLSVAEAEKQLASADAKVAKGDVEVTAKLADQQRARRMLAVAKRSR